MSYIATLLASLFQASKAHLSPAGRAFVASLEIVIVSAVFLGLSAGYNYFFAHGASDPQALTQFAWSAFIIALLKGFASLAPQVQKFVSDIESQVSQPVAQTPQVAPAAPPVQVPQFTTPVPQPVQFVQPLVSNASAQQTYNPPVSPTPAFSYQATNTYPMPTVPGQQ